MDKTGSRGGSYGILCEIRNLQGHQETVKEHLQKVAALAREYGEALGLADAAGLEGLVHDLESIPRRFRMCGKANEQALTMR